MAKEMKRRQFLAAFAATAGGAVLAACAPKAEPTAAPAPAEAAPKAEAPKEEAPKPAAQEQVVLRLNMRAGGEQSEPSYYVDRPKELMEEYPYITVELVPIPADEYYTKIQTMAAAGSLGDVVFAQDDYSQQRRHAVNGLLQASEDWLDANGHSKSEWLPSSVDAITYEGKMYGLPKSASPSQCFIFYNQDMFEEAGIAFPPKHGCTIEELVEWSDKVTKGPEDMRDVFGVSFDLATILGIHNWVRAFGSFALNEEGTKQLSEGPEWYEAMQYLYGFYQRQQVPRDESLPTGGRRALFAAGKLAIMVGGRWEWKGIKAAVEALEKPFRWETVEIPHVENAKGWRASVNSHDPSTQTKHPHEAYLLGYALADKRMAELSCAQIGYLSARVDDSETIAAMDDADPTKAWLQLQYECQLKTENFRGPANLRGLELNTTTKNFLDQLWLGQEELTPDFMKRFTAACQEILDKPL